MVYLIAISEYYNYIFLLKLFINYTVKHIFDNYFHPILKIILYAVLYAYTEASNKIKKRNRFSS